jgi:glycosyltransferase involved in cell wall biosynthesis
MNKKVELKAKIEKSLHKQCKRKNIKLTLEDIKNAILNGNKITSTSDTVNISLKPSKNLHYCRIECSIIANNPSASILLYGTNENAAEYNEKNSIVLGNANGNNFKISYAFPTEITKLRIDIRNPNGDFEIKNFSITPYSHYQYKILRKLETIKKIIHHVVYDKSLIKKFFRVFKTRGLKFAMREIYIKLNKHKIKPLSTYIYRPAQLTNDIKNEIKSFKKKPLISIVMPVYNAPPDLLKKAFNSIKNQWYDNWEVCIADDASTNRETLEFLKNINNPKIKIKFLSKNLNISGASNAAFKTVSGEYTALMDDDDELTNDALYQIVKVINETNAEFIYSDEDKLEMNGTFVEPHFKADFLPDLFLSQNYINHLCVIKTDLIKQVGGWTLGLEGAQDYDLFLKVTELTNKIQHIPEVLYHWRRVPGSTAAVFSDKHHAQNAGLQALKNALKRRNIKAKVSHGLTDGTYKIFYNINDTPKVSIIIPFKDKSELLKKCITSILEKSTYQNYEILCINNNSKEIETEKLIKSIKATDERIKFYDYNKKFNYSALNNYAVNKLASGDFIIFLNNDIEIITPSWIQEMLSFAQRDNTACVGAKLYFPNNYIQHAGIVVAPYTDHALIFMYSMMERNGYGYFARAKCINNYAAVTAACMMIKKELFIENGGFEEDNLAIAYNDIDFCLKMYKKGYLNVFTPFCEAYHDESSTRGYEKSNSEIERREKEKFFLKHTHRKLFSHTDPHFSPNLNPNSGISDIHPKNTPEFSKFIPQPFTQKILNEKIIFSEKRKDNICIFSHYSPNGIIDDYILFYLKSLSEINDIIFVSTSETMQDNELKKVENFSKHIIIKENYGYDFGAWKTGFDIASSSLYEYDNLILCNDSVFGPLFPLNDMLTKMQEQNYDVFAVNDNHQIEYHLQSYFIIYSKKAFSHPVFQNFYKEFKIIEDKQTLIVEKEIKFSKALIDAGLKIGAYNKASDFDSFQNIMHQYWKELITEYKCPFIKRELLKFNPLGIDISKWKQIIKKSTKYNLEYITKYLKQAGKE